MANLEKNLENNKRLQVLEERREKLILLNQINNFTQSGNPRIEKYFTLLKNIKREKYELEKIRFQEHKKNPEHQFLMATKGLCGTQILMLNN